MPDVTNTISAMAAEISTLRELLDNIGAHVYTKDLAGRYTYANAQVHELFGRPLEDIVGRDDSEFFDLHVYNQLRANDQRVLAQGETVAGMETNLVLASGEKRVYWTVKSPLRDHEGAICGISGISTDITDRVRLEEELKHQRLLLDTVLDNVDAHIYVKGPDSRYLYANSQAAAVMGHSAQDIVGRPESDFFPPEVAERFAQVDQRVIQSGKRETIEEIVVDAEGNRRTFWTTKMPIALPEHPQAVIGFSTDITDLKDARQARETAESMFRGIVEQSLVGVYLIQDGHFRYANPHMAAMLGYGSPAEIVNRMPVTEVVVAEDRKRVVENVRRRLAGEVSSLNYTFGGLRRDGSRFDIEVFGNTVSMDGKPAVIGIALDITERLRANRELKLHQEHLEDLVFARTCELADARDEAESAARAKSAFLANMSHELRTPLNHILGFTQLLALDMPGENNQRRLDGIERAAWNLLHLLSSLLDLARIESERLRIESIEFEFPLMLDQVERSLRGEVEAKGLRWLRVVSPGIPPALLGDPVRIAQVLRQLLDNAVKFSTAGCITLQAAPAQLPNGCSGLRFAVSDEGIGISPEVSSGLFQLFTQGDNTETRRYGGTGVGLALSKRLVTLMGGDIGFTRNPGAGTTFWFTVPLKPAAVRTGTGEGSEPDWQRLGEVTAYLCRLLAEGDIEATTLWGKNPGLFAPILADRQAAFAQAMATFDFPTALAQLQEAAAELPLLNEARDS